MCEHEKGHVSTDVIESMKQQPEMTLGDLRRQWSNLPDSTIIRVDAGCCFTELLRPEQVGLIGEGWRFPGNNVRVFGLSEPGEGVAWIEL
jgi:hypothetical protein